MTDFAFTPQSITIQVGSTVTWRNDGPSAHTATAGDTSFSTGILKSGERRTATFNQVGSFDYVCTLHTQMTGTVVVESVGSSVDDAPTSTKPAPGTEQPEEEKPVEEAEEDEAAPKHPRTGADLGIELLLGVALLAVGANARRFVRPGRTV